MFKSLFDILSARGSMLKKPENVSEKNDVSKWTRIWYEIDEAIYKMYENVIEKAWNFYWEIVMYGKRLQVVIEMMRRLRRCKKMSLRKHEIVIEK